MIIDFNEANPVLFYASHAFGLCAAKNDRGREETHIYRADRLSGELQHLIKFNQENRAGVIAEKMIEGGFMPESEKESFSNKLGLALWRRISWPLYCVHFHPLSR